MYLLEVRNLVKNYGRKRVVSNVSFEVAPGEIVGLLGANGAGKTTSFRMTMGMIKPDGGEVIFDGHNVTHLPMYLKARHGMGYLSQEPSVFQRMTVRNNLLAVLEGLPLSRKERMQEVARLLSESGLEKVARSSAHTLSGGERRRLEITRALINKPSLLLLDEPFSGIDPKRVADFQRIISRLRDLGIGILLTDHNVRDTLEITDRAYIIHEGHIIKHGKPSEIVDDVMVRRLYLGDNFRL
ncbi:MAG: LPS export ABC transporter ATP-binding protein [Gemmatimonadales bacterium]|nr:MAG: LPS export ABC transporter ATP-binding protein [Gemmatimonadales bacterium]